MTTASTDDRIRPDPLEALLADWLTGVMFAAHGHPDVDSTESYAHATREATQVRCAAERLARAQVEWLCAELERRAAGRDALRTSRGARRHRSTARHIEVDHGSASPPA